MSAWCLIQSQANKFIKGLQSGEIDPEKLSDMSSEDRHSFLSKYVGEENATNVNSLFESKLLLKNQQTGMINWAKRVAGLKPEVRRDLITRIGKLDTILNPDSGFLKDLATTKLGTEITAEEAKNVFDLSNKVKETQASMKKDNTFETKSQASTFGHAKVDLVNYVNDLKGYNKLTFKQAADVAGLSKSIRASMDDSAIFRQGWKTLMTHPSTWAKNALKTFSDAVKTFGGKNVMDEIQADMYSRQNELNGNYKKMGLAITRPEEALPSTLPEKLPLGVGRAYKATETAYTGFVYRLRMDIADKYIEIAQNSGVELTPKELKSIGSMVNSLTGRGNFGKFEPAAEALNTVFFSPRNIKAQFDTLGHVFTGAGGSNFVRRQAAINLVKVISGTAAVLAVANALKPGSVETDPRSSDFGKIKVGDTRFDVTGGMSSLITLAARLATMSSKSSTTGIVNPLNSGKYGAQTGTDVVVNFLENKLSPVGSVLKDITTGKDFNGNKLTVGGEAANLFLPLSISTYAELKADPNSAPVILSMIADGLGIATNTYGQQTKDWSQNPTKTQQQFKDTVGDKKFKAANDKFNLQYSTWLAKTIKSKDYKSLSAQDKQTVLSNGKKDIQAKILDSYGFTYTKSSRNTDTINSLKP